MKIKKSTIGIALVLLVIAITAELFYFRFHTYLQDNRVDEAMPASENGGSMTVVAQGQFVEVDIVHKGSGTAKIIEQDGMRYLRFENFEVTNGPDLYVYLSNSQNPGGSIESLGSYVNLGLLKGNRGNQNYEIPAEAQGYDTAVIWCQQFGVLFSYAVMR